MSWWLLTALEITCWSIAAYAFYQVWVHKRGYRVGDIVWAGKDLTTGLGFFSSYKSGEWGLARVEELTEYKGVYYVNFIDGPRHVCVGTYRIRPIRWWQRTKVDPIIMKYYLLNGWGD